LLAMCRRSIMTSTERQRAAADAGRASQQWGG
jgi:hypothetical protein